MKLANYLTGKWIEGDGDGQQLYNAFNGEQIANATTQGLDFAGMLAYGRKVGSPALQKMTFQERGRMLRALALHLTEKKKFFIPSVIKRVQQEQIAG
ncbi:MAG: hypothetical protein WKF59_09030 [Chitinophagaceae bacterium]